MPEADTAEADLETARQEIRHLQDTIIALRQELEEMDGRAQAKLTAAEREFERERKHLHETIDALRREMEKLRDE